MFQDSEAYPEPHLFKPERYLTEDGKKINPNVRDPRDIVFGFGRR
jgi:cytochrome P450